MGKEKRENRPWPYNVRFLALPVVPRAPSYSISIFFPFPFFYEGASAEETEKGEHNFLPYVGERGIILVEVGV